MRVSDFSAYIHNLVNLFFPFDISSSQPKPSSIPIKESSPDIHSQEFRNFLLQDAFRVRSEVTQETWQRQSPLLFSPWGVLTGMTGCIPLPAPGGPWRSGGVAWVSPLPDYQDLESRTIRSGPDNYEKSTCEMPVDMESLPDGDNLVITCGDTGKNQIDDLRVSTAGIKSTAFPNVLFGDKSKYINLVATTLGPKGKVFTVFEAHGSNEDFEKKIRDVNTSGIYVSNSGKGEDIWGLTFDRIDGKFALPSDKSTGTAIDGFQPNSPRAILFVQDKVFVLNSNKVIDPISGRVTYAPLTVHSYKIDESLPYLLKKDSFTFLRDAFNPLAMAFRKNGYLAVLTGGIPGLGLPPSIEMISQNFAPVRTSIPIVGENTVDSKVFMPASFSDLPILNDRYALVGSADGSGRVAIVDLNWTKGNSTKFVTVLEGQNIAGILKGQDGSSAYVLSSSGYVKKMSFDFSDGSVKLGPSYRFAGQFSKNYRIGQYSNGLIVAGPGGYHRIPERYLTE